MPLTVKRIGTPNLVNKTYNCAKFIRDISAIPAVANISLAFNEASHHSLAPMLVSTANGFYF